MCTALIVIVSPLQAICAVEAIKEYRLQEYKILLLKEGKRTAQVVSFLEERGFEYEMIEFDHSYAQKIYKLRGLFMWQKIKYDYLFMGDLRLFTLRCYLSSYLKKGGKIVFIDDGNYLLLILNNMPKQSFMFRLKETLFSIFACLKRIDGRNLFTCFADDIPENNMWKVKCNELKYLQAPNKSMKNEVYVIGTVIDVYCNYIGLSTNRMMQIHERLFEMIENKYEGAEIVYLPHGRDQNTELMELCENRGVNYKSLDRAVELWIMGNTELPVAVYGFTSTALYTLHLLFPQIAIYNIFPEGHTCAGAEAYSYIGKLYLKHGIKLVML